MKGWGRLSFLIVTGMWLAAGCGGRTDALESDYVFGESGSSNLSGSTGLGGATSTSGSGPVAGHAGHGGKGSAGTSAGGKGSAGHPGGGAAPVGGSPGGGFSFGGVGPIGGFAGFPSGGSFPVAGFANGGFGGGPAECLNCLRDQCSMPLVSCFTDFGCIAIFSCMQQTHCQAFQCYSAGECKSVIDQWGGPAGKSMTELLQTVSCAFSSGCQCG